MCSCQSLAVMRDLDAQSDLLPDREHVLSLRMIPQGTMCMTDLYDANDTAETSVQVLLITIRNRSRNTLL